MFIESDAAAPLVIKWVDVEDVKDFHANYTKDKGHDYSVSRVSENLLRGALSRPRQHYEYGVASQSTRPLFYFAVMYTQAIRESAAFLTETAATAYMTGFHFLIINRKAKMDKDVLEDIDKFLKYNFPRDIDPSKKNGG